ncbi:hypothetical protein [uncultured Eudoraea sp.]|uniref:hypothetical protein n=1 Tax=uncultured Eudoraea sp. TaxID=1035614 RepID=UPI00261466F5|nr:hypothetical protein [uncultured Eudoraea sp.]
MFNCDTGFIRIYISKLHETPLGTSFILETIGLTVVDSFLFGVFFDPIFQQKEGFSPYVFENLAIEIIKNNDRLRESFEFKKETDEAFRQNSYDQL